MPTSHDIGSHDTSVARRRTRPTSAGGRRRNGRRVDGMRLQPVRLRRRRKGVRANPGDAGEPGGADDACAPGAVREAVGVRLPHGLWRLCAPQAPTNRMTCGGSMSCGNLATCGVGIACGDNMAFGDNMACGDGMACGDDKASGGQAHGLRRPAPTPWRSPWRPSACSDAWPASMIATAVNGLILLALLYGPDALASSKGWG